MTRLMEQSSNLIKKTKMYTYIKKGRREGRREHKEKEKIYIKNSSKPSILWWLNVRQISSQILLTNGNNSHFIWGQNLKLKENATAETLFERIRTFLEYFYVIVIYMYVYSALTKSIRSPQCFEILLYQWWWNSWTLCSIIYFIIYISFNIKSTSFLWLLEAYSSLSF